MEEGKLLIGRGSEIKSLLRNACISGIGGRETLTRRQAINVKLAESAGTHTDFKIIDLQGAHC